MSTSLVNLVGEFITFKTASGMSSSTIANLQNGLKLFLECCGDVDVNSTSLEKTMHFMKCLANRPSHRGGHVKKSTIASYMMIVKSFYEWLSVYRDIRPFDYHLIMIPHTSGHRLIYLTEDEFNRIIGCINCRTFEGIRLRAMLETYMSTGARLSGILDLKISDVDLINGEATIRLKGGEYLQVYLNTRSKYWIKKYLERRTDKCEYLWISRHRSGGIHQLKKNALEYQIIGLKNTARVGKDWSIHTLRHTYATQILQNGASVRVVQDLLGHKSLNSTMIYTHYSNVDLKSQHKKYLKI